MKRISSFLLALLMILALIPATVAEEPVTLRILWWGSQTRHDLTMAAIEKFMEKNPDIKIEAEYTSWDGYWEKVATQIAGGVLPDVIQMDHAYLAQYSQAGVLEVLNPYFESGAIDISDVAQGVIDAGKCGGDEVYALSTGTNALVTMYRKDVLDQAGVVMPMEPTIEELAELSRKVYEATGHHNSNFNGFDGVRYYLRSYGLNFYADDGTSLGFDDPKYIADIWQGYVDGIKEGWIKDVGELSATTAFDNLIDDYWAGWHWTNELAAYENGNGFPLEMSLVPVPSDATVPPTFFKASMYWSINSKSTVKDAAARFINFFTNDPDCFDIVGIDRAIPISSKIREHITPNLNETSQRVAAMIDYLGQEGKTSPIMPPDIAVHSQINALLGEYFEQVQYGMVDDLTAHAQAFMDEANEIIAKSLVK